MEEVSDHPLGDTDSAAQEASYVCPLDLSQPPALLHEEIIGQATNEEFIKSAKFSPDGSSVVTCSESNYLTFWSVPEETVKSASYFPAESGTTGAAADATTGSKLQLTNAMDIGESIYDCVWYPHMSASNPPTCCVLVSSRDHPVQLWDTLSGKIRCKYTAFDHMDEIEAAQSISFNLAGDKIYSGANRVIRIFDAANPGRQETNVPTCRTRKDKFGQKGIISAISFCPDFSGLYAAGSFSQNVGLYAENTNKRQALVQPLGMGITHLKWSPCGYYLWAGGRKKSEIICIDIRMSKREVGRVDRPLASNQRVSFDIDPWGKYLVTGTQDGEILAYRTETFELASRVGYSYETNKSRLVRDCINSATIHPFSSLLVTASGQRHFDETYDDDVNDQNTTGNPEAKPMKYSSGLQLWSLPKLLLGHLQY